MNNADVKMSVVKIGYPNHKQWITAEAFTRMRREISEVVPVLLVLGLSLQFILNASMDE